MAIDNTPPRIKLIITIAAITVVTLVSLDFVFKSYYAAMTDEAQRLKIRPTTEADKQHEAEREALAHASIDQAINQFARGARAEIITPQPSDDLAPMTGWSKLPKPAPVRQAHPAPIPEHVEPSDGGVSPEGGAALSTGDGGAPVTDGGAPGANKDASAPQPAPTPHHGGGH